MVLQAARSLGVDIDSVCGGRGICGRCQVTQAVGEFAIRALYLFNKSGDTGYRLHASPEWNSIGGNMSSGCIRLMNQDVIDLYNRVQVGAKVIVQ